MSDVAIGWIAFACVFGGALLGMFLRAALPEHHLSPESQDVVKLVMGLISIMSALVLGLLIAFAKSAYDTQSNELAQISTDLIVLDRIMTHYGPETQEARDLFRRLVAAALDRMWPENRSQPAPFAPMAGAEVPYDKLVELSPQHDTQRALQAQALGISSDILRTRWLLGEQRHNAIAMPFLVILVFWLTVLFVSFGLFAPSNATVVATLFVCALSVSGAIFLILDLDRPFEGLIQFSSAPLRDALMHLGQ